MTASISIPSHDDIHDQIIAWVSEQAVAKTGRSMRARSKREGSWDCEDDLVNTVRLGPGSVSIVNFSHWEARAPPKFEPHNEFAWFKHKGHSFRLLREKETILNNQRGFNMVASDENLTITVFGRSLQPIKDLIKEARESSFVREKSRTTVRRPGPKEYRSRGIYAWTVVANRPSRPLETVVLDSAQKHALVMDINEYLHPATPRWYANRGIPYRRGYLFHGPPGTGKTSLSFAIAGVFGLAIYCISLLEPSLTEEDLALLFNALPRRCVVLLEDIDTAGLSRNAEPESNTVEAKKDGENATADDEAQKPVKLQQKPRKIGNSRRTKDANGDDSKGISLSGLLNAIDGVASHEGRVLVMTTNHLENLDDALIRPGRVDMLVEFTLANKEQIREIFIRMYSPDTRPKDRIDSNEACNADPPSYSATQATPAFKTVREKLGDIVTWASPNEETIATISTADSKDNEMLQTDGGTEGLSDPFISELEHLANDFAELIPEKSFSPAEIQGFLLTRKRDPHRAVREVAKWGEGILKARK